MSRRSLTIAEAAQRSGVSVSALDRWRIDGLGPPSQRIDGRISYDEECFEAWLVKYQTTAAKGRQRPGPRRR